MIINSERKDFYLEVLLENSFLKKIYFESILTRCMGKKQKIVRYLFYIVCSPFFLINLIGHKNEKEKKDSQFISSGNILDFNYMNKYSIKMYLPLYDAKRGNGDYIQQRIFMFERFYEDDLLNYVKKKYMNPHMVIMDCGSNIGNHSVFFGKICEAKKIYAFEAIRSTYQILLKNIELNNLSKIVIPKNIALGEKETKAKINNAVEGNIGGTSIKEDNDGSIDMTSIDLLHLTEKIDFMKIDVEGYEYHVLLGARHMLSENAPIIWIEIDKDNFIKVDGILKEYGYKLIETLRSSNYIYTKSRRK